MRVTSTHTTPMGRQVRGCVNLSNFKGPVFMDIRNEMGVIRRRGYTTARGSKWRSPPCFKTPCSQQARKDGKEDQNRLHMNKIF